jgi:hypothetical protein
LDLGSKVLARIVAHLARQGFPLRQVADAACKAPGLDILADREGR